MFNKNGYRFKIVKVETYPYNHKAIDNGNQTILKAMNEAIKVLSPYINKSPFLI